MMRKHKHLLILTSTFTMTSSATSYFPLVEFVFSGRSASHVVRSSPLKPGSFLDDRHTNLFGSVDEGVFISRVEASNVKVWRFEPDESRSEVVS